MSQPEEECVRCHRIVTDYETVRTDNGTHWSPPEYGYICRDCIEEEQYIEDARGVDPHDPRI